MCLFGCADKEPFWLPEEKSTELKPDEYIFEVMEEMILEKDRRFLYLFVSIVAPLPAPTTSNANVLL